MADRGMRSFSQVVVAILALVTKLRLALVTKLCIALVTKLHSSRYQALLGNDILEALLPVNLGFSGADARNHHAPRNF